MQNGLLPYPWKIAGGVLTLAGIVMAVLFLEFDLRLTKPVFAVLSSFLETKMFVVFSTNIIDELILLLLIAGFAMIVFSKERDECRQWKVLRFRALFQALLWNTAFLLFSIIFIFGNGFLFVLVINLFSVFIFYLVFFYILKRKFVTSH